jgi:hypothetical protein
MPMMTKRIEKKKRKEKREKQIEVSGLNQIHSRKNDDDDGLINHLVFSIKTTTIRTNMSIIKHK